MDVAACVYHADRPGPSRIMIEGGSVIRVCEECRDRILLRDRYSCKFCGIPIKGKDDTTPFADALHKFGCPRY